MSFSNALFTSGSLVMSFIAGLQSAVYGSGPDHTGREDANIWGITVVDASINSLGIISGKTYFFTPIYIYIYIYIHSVSQKWSGAA